MALTAKDGYRADKTEHILNDLDSKFTGQFCDIVESDGIVFELIRPRSPKLNPFAERWVQSVKRECLDHVIVFGEADQSTTTCWSSCPASASYAS